MQKRCSKKVGKKHENREKYSQNGSQNPLKIYKNPSKNRAMQGATGAPRHRVGTMRWGHKGESYLG